jgi:hypothetical protein
MNGETCSDCGHHWKEHKQGDGCLYGWTWDREGIAVNEGCTCQLAHMELSPSDWETAS